MLAHYLAVALAKFRKTPFTTAANVLTLALGLACFIAAYGIATYWRSADSYHEGGGRTFVLGQALSLVGQPPAAMRPASSATAGRYLREEMPEITLVRAIEQPSVAVAAGEAKLFLNTAVVEPGFLDLFDFTFVAGDARGALDEPNSVVLTADAARRLFADAPALGQRIIVAGDEDGVVAGVIAPVRQPSFMGAGADATLQFDMLRHWSSSERGAEADARDYWAATDTLNFVQLPPGFSVEALNARLPDFLQRRSPDQGEFGFLEVVAFPVGELTTRSLNSALFLGSASGVSATATLVGLGLLTLLVACVNYASLASAQAAMRAKEVGLRRVLGGGRVQIMTQAWLEALLLAGAAVLIALGVLALTAPVAKSFAGVDMLYFLTIGPAQQAVVAGLVALVAVVAGAYPAFALSRVRASEALRSRRPQSGSRVVTRVLVAVQFASASFLLIVLTVTQLQRAHLERTALAPREDPIVILNDLMPIGVDYDTLAARLAELPGVQSVSVVDKAPWELNGFNPLLLAISPEAGQSPSAPLGFVKRVGYDYFETLNIRMLAGRTFDRERDTIATPEFRDVGQTVNAIVDATFASRIGFATPEAAVDQIVFIPARPRSIPPYGTWPNQPVRIVGVSEADTTRLRANRNSAGETVIAGVAHFFAPRAPSGGQHPIVRLDRDRVPTALDAIVSVWDELAPTVPADIRFYDDLFKTTFRTFERVGQLFALLASAAFVIASIGLLGMAVHVTSRRRHEIGVRKTMGSTSLGIVRLLLIDFSKPILIANVLAWPLAYLAAETYLAAFTDRVTLTPAPFAISLALTLALAWAAVIGEVLKAASVRPAEVLRHA